MPITKKLFGKLAGGDEVCLYELDNGEGLCVEILSYGAIVKSIQLGDCAGRKHNVVLGYDDLHSYANDTAYLGATIGRNCNRIEKSSFLLAGQTVNVIANEGANQLHGGKVGFNQRVWLQKSLQDSKQPRLELEYISPAGEQGFPGNLRTTVSYELTRSNELRIEFSAQTDATTIVNLTNHSYFNLHGDRQRTVLDHIVQIRADNYLPVNTFSLPTGTIQAVDDSPFDFRVPVAVASAMSQDNEQISLASGFDHNWILNYTGGELREVATAKSLLSGIELNVATTQPGLQFYTGNHLQAAGFAQHAAFCFEAQHFPNSPNHADFPSTVLAPGEDYSQTTVYAFACSKGGGEAK